MVAKAAGSVLAKIRGTPSLLAAAVTIFVVGLMSWPPVADPVYAVLAWPAAAVRRWVPGDGAMPDQLAAVLLIVLASLLAVLGAHLCSRALVARGVLTPAFLRSWALATIVLIALGGWPRASGTVGRTPDAAVPGHHDFGESGGLTPLLDDRASTALWRLEKASAAGDMASTYLLGTAYLYGYGAKRDTERAADLLDRATAQGSGAAAWTLAQVYEEGRGITRDLKRAHRLTRLASERTHARQDAARARLATQLERGLGTVRDRDAARSMFEEAAPRSADAAYGLASILESEGKAREAFDLYFDAGLVGHPEAQHALSRLYERGVGVASNTDLAHEWRGRAAQQGLAAAQIEHGRRLLAGARTVEQRTRAIEWIELAAEQGHPDALFAAGQILLSINQRRVAYYYLNLAAAMGSAEAATLRNRLKAGLTSAELRDAERRSGVWSAQKPLTAYRLASSGTGFFVDVDHTFITNEHVVSECARLAIARERGEEVWDDVGIIAADAETDVAILRVSVKEGELLSHGVARLRSTPADVGLPVTVFGFPLADVLSVGGSLTTGVVSSAAGVRDDKRVLQMSAPIQPGNSGSAIFDEWGGVLGIARSSLAARFGAQNVNFGTKSQVIATMLRQHGRGYFLTRPGAAALDARSLAAAAESASARVLCYAHK